MSTAVLDRPDVRDQTGTEKPDLFHYVDKNQMMVSAIEGGTVKALCGAVFPVRKVPKPDSPVCPVCEEIWEGLKP